MKISELVVYPLLSLALVFFIYYLAAKESPPPVIHKPQIRIQSLQVSETAHPGSNGQKNIPMATNQKQTSLLHTSMYNKKPFIDAQYSFIPSERIYLVIELQNLQAGKHSLTASWKIQNGKTVSISSHDIDLKQFTPWHRTYFWLELMKNGRFTETFTGREYKEDAYGTWEVEVALDGTIIAKQHFEIKDI